MRLFISWSGERSQALASALHEWIPMVLQYVEPWMSASDIDAGDRWANHLGKELEGCSFGVSCITRENPTAPWLLFEAGALAKQVENGKLIPLLLDHNLKDFEGPLAQFQAKKVDEKGVFELLDSLNKAASNPVGEGRIKPLFDMAWPNLAEKIKTIPESAAGVKNTRPQGEILEELVSGVRMVESRVREAFDDDYRYRRKGRRRFPITPMAFELSHAIGRSRSDPIQLLIFASFFRDELPWLYEMASEAYQAIRSGNRTKAKSALLRFRRAVDVIDHGPFRHEIAFDEEAFHMLSRELLEQIKLPAMSAKEAQKNDELETD